MPAVLCGPFSDILAANDAAWFLYGTDFERSAPPLTLNSIHWMLTSPVARALYDECWEQTATEMIGKLRVEVRAASPVIPRAGRSWRSLPAQRALPPGLGAAQISDCVQGVKTLRHRLGGVLRMRANAVTVYSSPGQVFYVMLPADTAFETAYREHSGKPRGS